MIRNKKAIFLSVSIFIFLTAFFMMSSLLIKQQKTSTESFSQLGFTTRMKGTFSSIDNAFSEIVNEEAEITLTKGVNSVLFEEDLPNNNDNGFDSSVDSLKSWIEGGSDIVINVDDMKGNLPIRIEPYNLTYSHNSFGGNQIRVLSLDENLTGYSIELTITNEVAACGWSYNSGDLELRVKVNGPSTSCDETHSISRTSDNQINVNSGQAYVEVNSSNLYITNNGAGLESKVNVSTLENNNQVYTSIPQVTEVNESSIGFYASRGVTIN